METKKKSEWLSVHLFYSGSLNSLLLRSVDPLIKELRKRKLIRNFFFIRYAENGPHIRLRIKGVGVRKNHQIKNLINDHLNAFFEMHPSPEIPSMEGQFFYPMNSIQYIDYEPEIERYGGPVGVVIAEKMFEASSKAVLKILEGKIDVSYDDAISCAIQLNLCFSFSFQMTLAGTRAFYESISNSMGRPSIQYSDGTSQSIHEIFERSYGDQKQNLMVFFSGIIPYLWSGSGINKRFGQNWLNKWIIETHKISKVFYAEIDKGRIILRQRNLNMPTIIDDAIFKPEWSIFYSYVHMTNNRMGLLNPDEPYIAYLIFRTIKDLNVILDK